jgi:hypothetical protein
MIVQQQPNPSLQLLQFIDHEGALKTDHTQTHKILVGGNTRPEHPSHDQGGSFHS